MLFLPLLSDMFSEVCLATVAIETLFLSLILRQQHYLIMATLEHLMSHDFKKLLWELIICS